MEKTCRRCGKPGQFYPERRVARLKPRATVRLRIYDVIERAISEGCEYGGRRATKHNDHPTPAEVAEECRRAVINALDEVIDFDSEGR